MEVVTDDPRALELLHRVAVRRGCTVGIVGLRKGESALMDGQTLTFLEVREYGNAERSWPLRELVGRQPLARPVAGRAQQMMSVDQAAERLLLALGVAGGDEDGA
jgi:hypothetical protein